MSKKQKNKNRLSNDQEVKNQLQDIKVELKDGIFVFTGPIQINEFARKINKPLNEILTLLFKKGKMYNANFSLSEEEIAELCFDYGFDFKKEISLNESNFLDSLNLEDKEENLVKRPPIITIMGHVDHGKTTLIDAIRNSNVSIASKEKGGITQHVGAYQIKYKNQYITFLDTPGHEAFTAMRSNGAKVTDIVILVVAADDGVMPQTLEAINHAKNANVPIIVFVNKMDKPTKDVEKIKNDLSKVDIICDEWGGDNIFVYGSALKKEGINELFDAIFIQADIMNLMVNENRSPIGTVIDAYIDSKKGVVATLIVTSGTMLKRDFIVAGSNYGKIKLLLDVNNNEIEEAKPSQPVLAIGLNYLPKAGDKFIGLEDEKFAKKIAKKKAFQDKKNILNEKNINKVLNENQKVINFIVKSDVQGTADALKSTLENLSNDEVLINVVHFLSGNVNKSDILLAQASNASILTFNLKIDASIKNIAEQEKIEIKSFNIIYDAINEIKNIIKNNSAPKYKEQNCGEAIIQKVFFYSKVGNIAGCLATKGFILNNSLIRIYRKDKLIYDGSLDSLQHEKEQIKKVEKGKEFGAHFKDFNNIEVEDVIVAYEKILIEN